MVPDSFDGDAIAVYDRLLKKGLREIRSPSTTPGQRIAWARIAEHVLENIPETAERITEALSTARMVLDSPESVQRLIRGIWSCGGCRRSDGSWTRLVRWVVDLADRAIRGEQWATFAGLAHTLIRLDGVERDLSPEWERAIRAAYEVQSTWVSLFLFSHHYISKFQPNKETAPDWLRLLYSDRRLQDAFERECSSEDEIQCPVCKRVDP